MSRIFPTIGLVFPAESFYEVKTINFYTAAVNVRLTVSDWASTSGYMRQSSFFSVQLNKENDISLFAPEKLSCVCFLFIFTNLADKHIYTEWVSKYTKNWLVLGFYSENRVKYLWMFVEINTVQHHGYYRGSHVPFPFHEKIKTYRKVSVPYTVLHC